MSTSKKKKYSGLKELMRGRARAAEDKYLGKEDEQLTVLAKAREEFVGRGPFELIMSVMKS